MLRRQRLGRFFSGIRFSCLHLALFCAVINATSAQAVTLHYSGTSNSNLHINLSSYASGNRFQVGRGTTIGLNGSLDCTIDTETNLLSITGFFTTPGEYSIYSSNPGQHDSLKGLIGNSISFNATKHLGNYTYDTNTGWFNFGGEPDSGTVWSSGFLGGGVGVRGIQSLNNIATQGLNPAPVLYGSFASILNNIGIEVLLGAPLTYLGTYECGVTPRQGATEVPEPMTALPVLLGIGALIYRQKKAKAA